MLLGAHKTHHVAYIQLSFTNFVVMSRRCKVVKPDVGCQSSSAEPDSINWELCCLCQEEKDDHLQCPISAKGPKCGFEYLATNLLEFQKLNSLPVNVNLDKLDEGSGIAETLQSHAAMYHKSCYLKYKVRRLQKRVSVTSDDESSSKKTKSQLNVSICQQVQSIPKCFL